MVMSKVRAGILPESSAKTFYSIASTVVGIVAGAAVFPGLIHLYEWVGVPQSTGHGEVFIAALVFNFLLAAVMTAVGRVVLGWKPMQW